jgi:hypothetical protein
MRSRACSTLASHNAPALALPSLHKAYRLSPGDTGLLALDAGGYLFGFSAYMVGQMQMH